MIDLLRAKLKAAMIISSPPEQFGSPHLMTKALALVVKNFDNPSEGLPQVTISQAINAYRKTGNLPTFVDVKFVCSGLCQQTEQGALIKDGPLFSKLLLRVESYSAQPRRFLKCYQGLLASYFHFSLHHQTIHPQAKENWLALRQFLVDGLNKVLKLKETRSWLRTLSENTNVLEDDPCCKYGEFLANGQDAQFRDVCSSLGVQSSSWLMEEAVMAQIRAACGFSDAKFQEKLDPILAVINGEATYTLPEYLKISSLALLAIRYSRCASRPEHILLRTLLINKIGNPWLKRAAWDAYVKDEEARKMVDGWIKRQLIHDFFALLSDDGAADERRLRYWLRYAEQLDEMWFALGRYAMEHRGSDYRQVRHLASGRLLTLDNTTSRNNAFIMRLGDVLVVEFGIKGNACYLFNNNSLPFDLNKQRVSCDRSQLKNDILGTQLRHADTGHTSWEEHFDRELYHRIRWRPSEEPFQLWRGHQVRHEPSPPRYDFDADFLEGLAKFGRENNIQFTNERSTGGGIWVYTGNTSPETNRKLVSWGFTYRVRGWWKS